MTQDPGPARRGPAGGSRRRVAVPAERTISSTTLLAFVVPALTVAALATVHPAPTEEPGRPPEAAPLTRATVVCPPALPGTDEVRVASADPDGAGALRLRHAGDRELEVRPGVVASFTEGGRAVLLAEGVLAPGLVAGRSGQGAGTGCDAPAADTWFTGVGAGAEHTSVLQLVNPDGGPAVADITVLGPRGPVEVPALRGLTVRGNRLVGIDLAAVVPQREELAVRVQVSRGRLASSMVDRIAELGGGDRSADWLPGQPEPRADSHLLGLGAEGGDRTLVVSNPGEDEARVGLALVTERSEFTPTGVEELRVAPGATVSVDLGRVLGGPAARGALGLRLRSDHPVTATLRSLTGGDLSHAVAAPPVTGRAGTVVGPGPKALVLAGAETITDLTVRQRDAEGRVLEPVAATLRPGLGLRVRLTEAARYVELETAGVPVVAALESGPGHSVIPLADLVLESWVPQVRPALY